MNKMNLNDFGIVDVECTCGNHVTGLEFDFDDIVSHSPNTFEVYLYCEKCESEFVKKFEIKEVN